MDPVRYAAACGAVDRANDEDPDRQAILYSERMVIWVQELAPQGSEELLLAARAQHIRRWTVPRSTFPEGRTGYLQWREKLKKFHADTLGAIMKEAGYPEASVAKARQLLLRKNFAPDPEGQTLEDAACLVFLQFEFADFARKTDPGKVVDILRKTWGKMSPAARDHAGALAYGDSEKSLLGKALSPNTGAAGSSNPHTENDP